MTRAKIWRGIVGTGVIVIFALVALSIFEGRYIEAVAIGSIGSVFAWFALGAGKIGG